MPTVEHEISFTKLSKGVREHYERNKDIYRIGAIVGFAGITCVLMRGSIARGGMREGLNARGGLTNTASFIFRNKQTINVITVLERQGRGHPGYPVMCLEDKIVYLSQKLAAEAYDFTEGLLAGHLAGKFPDVDGRHFVRVSLPVSA